ncbi:transcription factor [Fusarium heterosporum]|uniref:Transcription factor n=1 Tax=Fusarium heterosporum TaxID=42747 RepID=A0A8H5WIY0_FUSHE|nr:transcription factor [Fusarium heterosporum]
MIPTKSAPSDSPFSPFKMGERLSLDEQRTSAGDQKRLAETDDPSAPKRRKLRKGTQSCWECKRRKAKCIFADSSDICDFCKRRGTDCVSQELAEKPPPPGSNKHIVDRLGEVEALVQHLLKNARSEGRTPDELVSPESLESRRRSPEGRLTRSKSPAIAVEDHSATATDYLASTDDLLPSNLSGQVTSVPDPYDDLYKELVTAWPNPQDMKLILTLPVEPSQIIRVMTCATSKDNPAGLHTPATLLRLPPRGSHPVLVARKMLVLAVFLQGVPLSSESALKKLTVDYETIMARIVKIAHDKVTCNDDFVSSLEGIECIMLEGLYENYAGNLRRSWLAARRAVMIAQMLGLDKGVVPPSFRGAAIEPSDLWFRLINFDRYLCLMLGFPQTSSDEPGGDIDALESFPSNQRLQNLCSIACARLLKRKPSELCDQAVTKGIDKLLRDACTSMPAQWWIMPNLASYSDLSDKLRETLRFNDHVMQYHLLLQLHMPYLLRVDDGNQYGYYKLAAVSASREVLTRFVSLRTVPQTRYFCRGTDLIAFVACTALTVAHILCDHRHKRIEDNGYHFLEQQRLSDRGLLEQVLTIAETHAHKRSDWISKRLMTLLHYLLAIEDNVTASIRYKVSFAENSTRDGDLGHRLHASDDGTVLDIHIPNLPVIKIVRRDLEGKEALPVLLEVPWGLVPPGQRQAMERNDALETLPDNDVGFIPLPSAERGTNQNQQRDMLGSLESPTNSISDPWALEGFDMSFLDNLIQGPTVV